MIGQQERGQPCSGADGRLAPVSVLDDPRDLVEVDVVLDAEGFVFVARRMPHAGFGATHLPAPAGFFQDPRGG